MTAPDGPQPDDDRLVVVRVALGRVVHVSERMALSEARTLTAEVRAEMRRIGDQHLLLPFHADGYPELFLRANRITSVGIANVGIHRRRTPRRVASQ